MSEPREIAIVTEKWGGRKKPTLTISMDALYAILKEEESVIDPNLLPDLMGSLHAYAVKARHHLSNQDALDAWEEKVEELEEEVEDSSEEDGDE